MKYVNRPQNEWEVIAKAYNFEIEAIENFDATRNPWVDEIKSWEDGEVIWEAINEAVEMRYC